VTGCRGKREVDVDGLPERPAGSAAQEIFEERKRKHRDNMRLALPGVTAAVLVAMAMVYLLLIGLNGLLAGGAVILVALTGWIAIARLPREALSWGRGAKGERKTSDALTPLQRRGFIVLHDRRIPGGRGNIDHVAIGPQGIFVIESKYLSGTIDVANNRLWIADNDRQNLIDEVYREAIATQIALGEHLNPLRLTVSPVLCIHGARVPLFDKRVAGIRLFSARELRQIADGPALLDAAQVQELAALADRQLRPMY
jgi:hypothetical protein